MMGILSFLYLVALLCSLTEMVFGASCSSVKILGSTVEMVADCTDDVEVASTLTFHSSQGEAY